uniref:Uncharacterized protein n=1 Tax=Knipowitschia caucasica TaxID=637954 RepID=A0AAV2LUP4_KNICA
MQSSSRHRVCCKVLDPLFTCPSSQTNQDAQPNDSSTQLSTSSGTRGHREVRPGPRPSLMWAPQTNQDAQPNDSSTQLSTSSGTRGHREVRPGPRPSLMWAPQVSICLRVTGSKRITV